ncbi:hypothetical protein BDN72DRAFT_856484 [Pluteus cervinus]|uniref:Uncharacterized protein n=1 Tax=Pluteus cervinus TaxID=181527 RepID=A0ACD3AZS5_9AGAR|nr:hypothetical protein BDN72DRAFT_856484 [Pluteus cervinus]
MFMFGSPEFCSLSRTLAHGVCLHVILSVSVVATRIPLEDLTGGLRKICPEYNIARIMAASGAVNQVFGCNWGRGAMCFASWVNAGWRTSIDFARSGAITVLPSLSSTVVGVTTSPNRKAQNAKPMFDVKTHVPTSSAITSSGYT